jgi:hypothetical protein
MISLETALALSDGGLPGLITKARKAGGEDFASEMIEGLLETICKAAVAALGRTRARELFEMQLTALERGGR